MPFHFSGASWIRHGGLGPLTNQQLEVFIVNLKPIKPEIYSLIHYLNFSGSTTILNDDTTQLKLNSKRYKEL